MPLSDPDSLDLYATEIRVTLPGGGIRRGSGYVVGPYRILTALHVIIGEDTVKRGETVPISEGIKIRAYGDFARAFPQARDPSISRAWRQVSKSAAGDMRWRPAHMMWPTAGAALPSLELAVLEVKPGDALPHVARAPRPVCVSPIGNRSCRGTGYPLWTQEITDEDTELSNPITILADLTHGPSGWGGMHALTVRNGSPQTAEGWRGLSGACFFDEELGGLLGLASRTRDDFGNAGLWLTKLGDAHPGSFGDFWTASGLARPIPKEANRRPEQKRAENVRGASGSSFWSGKRSGQ